jgi:hypothetical protein
MNNRQKHGMIATNMKKHPIFDSKVENKNTYIVINK